MIIKSRLVLPNRAERGEYEHWPKDNPCPSVLFSVCHPIHLLPHVEVATTKRSIDFIVTRRHEESQVHQLFGVEERFAPTRDGDVLEEGGFPERVVVDEGFGFFV